jgi:hypothetical protein
VRLTTSFTVSAHLRRGARENPWTHIAQHGLEKPLYVRLTCVDELYRPSFR